MRRNMKQIFKSTLALGLSAAMVTGSLPAGVLSTEAAWESNARDLGAVKVNPFIHYQTMEGWGTSLCWFANIIGGWTQDFNGNGTPDRDEIAELIFSPEYLNLNIVRYNIGGGENPSHDHMKREEAKVPSWKSTPSSELDPTADANQIWFLEQANRYQTEDVINEVFSNSPPYYMTNSGCATGNYDSGKNNLKDDQYDAFADYLTDVTAYLDQHLKQNFGTGIHYMEPINEPDTSYWGAGSTKQEGCHFDPGESQNRIYEAVSASMNKKGLNNVKLTGTDETSVDHAINSFWQLSQPVKTSLSAIGTHTYGSSNREVLKDIADSYDKDLWMSEVCYGSGGHNPDSMSNTSSGYLGDQVMADLKTLQSTAWVDWQAVDSEYECLQTDSNWGLIHAVFEEDGPVPDYHTSLVDEDGNARSNVPAYGSWHISKQFYTLMQYSKFIQAGYTMIDIGDGNMAAALSPDKTKLVVVVSNSSGQAKNQILDLSAFSNISSVENYRTSDTESCEQVNTENVSGNILNIQVPGNSVSTYVLSGTDALVSDSGYLTRVNSGVVSTEDTQACGADQINKFVYNGNWNRQTSQGSSYKSDVQSTSEAGAQASFTFEGNRAVLTGTKSAQGGSFSYSIDGGEPVTASSAADQTSYDQPLVDTGELSDGPHTLTVTLPSSGNATLAIDAANVYQGTIGQQTDTLLVTSVSPLDGSALIYFSEVPDAAGYTVRYGTTSDPSGWAEADKINGISSPVLVKNLVNDTRYFITIEANVPEQTPVPSGVFEVTPKASSSEYLYFVNAGIANPYDFSEYEPGRYQSSLEQAYGEDAASKKSWGYDPKALSASNNGSGIWESVRTDDQDTEGTGLSYQFELDPGRYLVEIGAYDPWQNGGRYQDYVVQGETISSRILPLEKTAVRCTAEVSSDGLLTVQAVRSSGNSGKNEDPLISYIKVLNYDKDAILTAASPADTIVASAGSLPQLPKKVSATKADGSSSLADVDWNTKDVDFSREFSSVTVYGTVTGTGLSVKAKVTVAPENLCYYIDSGSTIEQSDTFRLLSGAYDLKNDSPDQVYSKDSWGYVNDGISPYTTTSSDPYISGLYAGTDKDIIYRLPLDAGNYDVTVGLHEWWGVTRPMTLSAEYTDSQGKTTVLADTSVEVNGSRPSISSKLSVTLPETGELVLKVKKNGSSDPVISWLAAAEQKQHSSRETLQQLYDKYSTLSLNGYTSETVTAMKAALEKAKTTLSDTSASEQDCKAAAEDLEKAKTGLAADPEAPVEVVTVLPVITTRKGTQPALPESVEVKTSKDTVKKAGVTWNTPKASSLSKAYTSFTIKGKVENSDLTVSAKVEVIPENLVYYIDCGTAEAKTSPSYASVSSFTDLNNEVSDKHWETGSTWGILSGYDGVKSADSENKFLTGYYGVNKAGKDNGYAYKVTLDKGIYNVAAQSHEWWTGPRVTNLEASYLDENQKKVSTLLIDRAYVSNSSRDTLANGTLVIPADNTSVTLNIYSDTNEGAVITFLGIDKLSDYMVTSLTVTPPAKTVYSYNEALDTAGMKVTAAYTDHSVRQVDLANCTISGYDKTKAGTQTVTVTFAGKSASFTVTVKEQPVDAVKSVSAKAVSYNTASITWNRVPTAGGYELYRSVSPNGAYTRIASFSSNSVTSFTDKGLHTGTAYSYKVRAFRKTTQGTLTSADSPAASCKTALTAAGGVKAVSASYSKMKLTWKSVTGASGYEIYRSTSKKGRYSKIGTLKKGASTSFTDTKCNTGTAYYYKIRAYILIGSKPVYAVDSPAFGGKTVLGRPASVSLKKASRNSITVKWKKVPGASGYRVEYSTKKSSGFKKAALIRKSGTLSCKVTKLQKGRRYYARVRAYRTVKGKAVYGPWSKVNSLKLK